MDNIAGNITEYRKKLGYTQKDLGDMLNVSPQAVSKWENGQAEPDTGTIKKLCEIFKISTDELLGVARPAQQERIKEAQPERAPAPPPPPPPTVQTKIINGYCEKCNKPVGPNEYVVTHTHYGRGMSQQHVYCKKCNAEMAKAKATGEYADFRRQTKKSLIWGAIAGVGAAALFAVLFIAVVRLEPVWLTAIASVVVGIGYFAFIMQVFWDGVVIDVFMFFVHSFRLPGVIFTLDLDGLIFLVAFKVIGAIVLGILSALWFLFGLFVTPLISLVVLPFAAISRSAEGRRLEASALSAQR